MAGLKRDGDVLRGTCDNCGEEVAVSISGGAYCNHPLLSDCAECHGRFERGEADESSPFIVICDEDDCLRCKAMRVSIEQSKLLEKYEFE